MAEAVVLLLRDQAEAGLLVDVPRGDQHVVGPQRERAIAGEPVGSVFLVKENQTTAKLRLLLVEPQARGQGVGRRLVEECIGFAREKGYKKLVLWTQANLTAARNIYKTTGFKRVKQEAHRTFGPRVIGEYWELNLSP